MKITVTYDDGQVAAVIGEDHDGTTALWDAMHRYLRVEAATRAREYRSTVDDVCKPCEGHGKDFAGMSCDACHGSGKSTTIPMKESLRKASEQRRIAGGDRPKRGDLLEGEVLGTWVPITCIRTSPVTGSVTATLDSAHPSAPAYTAGLKAFFGAGTWRRR